MCCLRHLPTTFAQGWVEVLGQVLWIDGISGSDREAWIAPKTDPRRDGPTQLRRFLMIRLRHRFTTFWRMGTAIHKLDPLIHNLIHNFWQGKGLEWRSLSRDRHSHGASSPLTWSLISLTTSDSRTFKPLMEGPQDGSNKPPTPFFLANILTDNGSLLRKRRKRPKWRFIPVIWA